MKPYFHNDPQRYLIKLLLKGMLMDIFAASDGIQHHRDYINTERSKQMKKKTAKAKPAKKPAKKK